MYDFSRKIFLTIDSINPIKDGSFQGWKDPLTQNILHISHNVETCHNYTLPKDDSKKYINHMIHSFSFIISGYTNKNNIAFRYIFSNCFDYYWLSKSLFFNMVAILMISATLVTSGLPKNVICKYVNKVFDVIISVHYVSNKILLRDSNHIVHAVMWPKFDKCSISMRDVIIILFLQGFD